MRLPSYRRHTSGQARVTIGGKDFLLGRYGSKSSRQEYARLIAEFKASGGSKAFGKSEPLMQDVLLAFLKWAREYYKGTTQPYRYKLAMRPVADLYSSLRAREFGPKQFKAIREKWLEDTSRSRSYINSHMTRVVALVQWCVAEEFMDADQLVKVKAVKPLERGRTKAREPDPVMPVDAALVEATLRLLTPVQSDMVRFQLLTGCRPGELVRVCPSLVDRSTDVWTIRLDRHKTAHKGKQRVIYLGPQAQSVIAPYLLRAPTKPCFSPQESEKQRRLARHEARRTPMNYGNVPGSNIARKPRTEPGEAYTKDSYRRFVYYACIRGKLPVWSPNQLRHTRATEVRREFGLEGASLILGHSDLDVTKIYAEQDSTKAREIARLIG